MANMTVKGAFNSVGFTLKKNAPQIMTAVGVTATVAATGIIAYNSYKKLPKIVEEHKEDISKADDRKRALQVYGGTAWKLAKIYALPAGLLVGGIASIVGSDKIQTKRFNEVSAALGLTAAAYNELKKRLSEELGEEKLDDILMGTSAKDKGKEVETVDPETGEIIKKKVKSYDGMPTKSMYAIHFNKVDASGHYCNPNCKGEPVYDVWFINRVESMLNDKLRIRGENGKIWLSEIYSDLGCTVENLEITGEQELGSRVVGKRYDPENPLKFKIIERYYEKEHSSGVVDIWVDILGLDGNLYDKTYEKVMYDDKD